MAGRRQLGRPFPGVPVPATVAEEPRWYEPLGPIKRVILSLSKRLVGIRECSSH